MTLAEAEIGTEYIIKGLNTEDDELESFLFTLGCYSGEAVVVVSKISGSFVVSIKDGRYNIDEELASAILVSLI
ncbi:MAG: FeoA family protein [Eubacteriales bacterium]